MYENSGGATAPPAPRCWHPWWQIGHKVFLFAIFAVEPPENPLSCLDQMPRIKRSRSHVKHFEVKPHEVWVGAVYLYANCSTKGLTCKPVQCIILVCLRTSQMAISYMNRNHYLRIDYVRCEIAQKKMKMSVITARQHTIYTVCLQHFERWQKVVRWHQSAKERN